MVVMITRGLRMVADDHRCFQLQHRAHGAAGWRGLGYYGTLGQTMVAALQKGLAMSPAQRLALTDLVRIIAQAEVNILRACEGALEARVAADLACVVDSGEALPGELFDAPAEAT